MFRDLYQQPWLKGMALLLCTVLFSTQVRPSYAQVPTPMPVVKPVLSVSQPIEPVQLRGVKIDPEQPLRLGFIISDQLSAVSDQQKTNNYQKDVIPASEPGSRAGDPRLRGDDTISSQELEAESRKLIKYFLAALTIPEKDIWVNLSPHEADRIVPDSLGQTTMGRDLLAQDYLLKQITASLLHPDNEYGQQFWQRIYDEAFERYGTTEIPVDMFHKVWIMPDVADVYEQGHSVVVQEAKMKVMMERDYVAENGHKVIKSYSHNQKSHRVINSESYNKNILDVFYDSMTYDPMTVTDDEDDLSSEVMREIIIPAIEREVNTGAHFAPLRQIYHALILATWFKSKLKESSKQYVVSSENQRPGDVSLPTTYDLLSTYIDSQKTSGIDHRDTQAIPNIYAQYLESVREGVYDFIQANSEQIDVIPAEAGISADSRLRGNDIVGSPEKVTRRYFSGGFSTAQGLSNIIRPQATLRYKSTNDFSMTIDLEPKFDEPSDQAKKVIIENGKMFLTKVPFKEAAKLIRDNLYQLTTTSFAPELVFVGRFDDHNNIEAMVLAYRSSTQNEDSLAHHRLAQDIGLSSETLFDGYWQGNVRFRRKLDHPESFFIVPRLKQDGKKVFKRKRRAEYFNIVYMLSDVYKKTSTDRVQIGVSADILSPQQMKQLSLENINGLDFTTLDQVQALDRSMTIDLEPKFDDEMVRNLKEAVEIPEGLPDAFYARLKHAYEALEEEPSLKNGHVTLVGFEHEFPSALSLAALGVHVTINNAWAEPDFLRSRSDSYQGLLNNVKEKGLFKEDLRMSYEGLLLKQKQDMVVFLGSLDPSNGEKNADVVLPKAFADLKEGGLLVVKSLSRGKVLTGKRQAVQRYASLANIKIEELDDTRVRGVFSELDGGWTMVFRIVDKPDAAMKIALEKEDGWEELIPFGIKKDFLPGQKEALSDFVSSGDDSYIQPIDRFAKFIEGNNISFSENSRALIIGFGDTLEEEFSALTGRIHRFSVTHGVDVRADVVEKAAQKIRRTFRLGPDKIQLHHASMTKMSMFDDQSIDLVFSMANTIPSTMINDSLKEVLRVTKPGAAIYLQYDNGTNPEEVTTLLNRYAEKGFWFDKTSRVMRFIRNDVKFSSEDDNALVTEEQRHQLQEVFDDLAKTLGGKGVGASFLRETDHQQGFRYPQSVAFTIQDVWARFITHNQALINEGNAVVKAFVASKKPELNRQDVHHLASLIRGMHFDFDDRALEKEILDRVERELDELEEIIVRSSGRTEDSLLQNLAGAFTSIRAKHRGHAVEALKEVFAHAMYLMWIHQNGKQDLIIPGVPNTINEEGLGFLVEQFIPFTVSGTAYSSFHGFNSIEAVFGDLKNAVIGNFASIVQYVMGKGEARDVFRHIEASYDREPAKVTYKGQTYKRGDGALQQFLEHYPQEDGRHVPLSRAQAQRLNAVIEYLETAFVQWLVRQGGLSDIPEGTRLPLDIEWGFDEHDELYIVQARPVIGDHSKPLNESVSLPDDKPIATTVTTLGQTPPQGITGPAVLINGEVALYKIQKLQKDLRDHGYDQYILIREDGASFMLKAGVDADVMLDPVLSGRQVHNAGAIDGMIKEGSFVYANGAALREGLVKNIEWGVYENDTQILISKHNVTYVNDGLTGKLFKQKSPVDVDFEDNQYHEIKEMYAFHRLMIERWALATQARVQEEASVMHDNILADFEVVFGYVPEATKAMMREVMTKEPAEVDAYLKDLREKGTLSDERMSDIFSQTVSLWVTLSNPLYPAADESPWMAAWHRLKQISIFIDAQYAKRDHQEEIDDWTPPEHEPPYPHRLQVLVLNDEQVELDKFKQVAQIRFPVAMSTIDFHYAQDESEFREKLRQQRIDVAYLDVNMPTLKYSDAITLLQEHQVPIQIDLTAADRPDRPDVRNADLHNMTGMEPRLKSLGTVDNVNGDLDKEVFYQLPRYHEVAKRVWRNRVAQRMRVNNDPRPIIKENPKILIIDDSPEIFHGDVERLKFRGYDVESVVEEEAVEILRDNDVDIVIQDQSANMDAHAVLLKPVPYYFLISGLWDEDDIGLTRHERILGRRARKKLSKPIDFDDLIKEIDLVKQEKKIVDHERLRAYHQDRSWPGREEKFDLLERNKQDRRAWLEANGLTEEPDPVDVEAHRVWQEQKEDYDAFFNADPIEDAIVIVDTEAALLKDHLVQRHGVAADSVVALTSWPDVERDGARLHNPRAVITNTQLPGHEAVLADLPSIISVSDDRRVPYIVTTENSPDFNPEDYPEQNITAVLGRTFYFQPVAESLKDNAMISDDPSWGLVSADDLSLEGVAEPENIFQRMVRRLVLAAKADISADRVPTRNWQQIIQGEFTFGEILEAYQLWAEARGSGEVGVEELFKSYEGPIKFLFENALGRATSERIDLLDLDRSLGKVFNTVASFMTKKQVEEVQVLKSIIAKPEVYADSVLATATEKLEGLYHQSGGGSEFDEIKTHLHQMVIHVRSKKKHLDFTGALFQGIHFLMHLAPDEVIEFNNAPFRSPLEFVRDAINEAVVHRNNATVALNVRKHDGVIALLKERVYLEPNKFLRLEALRILSQVKPGESISYWGVDGKTLSLSASDFYEYATEKGLVQWHVGHWHTTIRSILKFILNHHIEEKNWNEVDAIFQDMVKFMTFLLKQRVLDYGYMTNLFGLIKEARDALSRGKQFDKKEIRKEQFEQIKKVYQERMKWYKNTADELVSLRYLTYSQSGNHRLIWVARSVYTVEGSFEVLQSRTANGYRLDRVRITKTGEEINVLLKPSLKDRTETRFITFLEEGVLDENALGKQEFLSVLRESNDGAMTTYTGKWAMLDGLVGFDPSRFIADVLETIPEVGENNYRMPEGMFSQYIRVHTDNVMRRFEEYLADFFHQQSWSDEITIGFMRLLLSLHDVGKERMHQESEEKTLEIIRRLTESGELPFTPKQLQVALALIDSEVIGLYMRGWIDLEEAKKRILASQQKSGLSKEEFFRLKTLYYQADVAAYITRRPRPDEVDGVNALFEWEDHEERLRVDSQLQRIKFRGDGEIKFLALQRAVLKEGSAKVIALRIKDDAMVTETEGQWLDAMQLIQHREALLEQIDEIERLSDWAMTVEYIDRLPNDLRAGYVRYATKVVGAGSDHDLPVLRRGLFIEGDVGIKNGRYQQYFLSLDKPLSFSSGLIYHGLSDLERVITQGSLDNNSEWTRTPANWATQGLRNTQEGNVGAIVMLKTETFNRLYREGHAKIEQIGRDPYPTMNAISLEEVEEIWVAEDRYTLYQQMLSGDERAAYDEGFIIKLRSLFNAGKIKSIDGLNQSKLTKSDQNSFVTAMSLVTNYLLKRDLMADIPLLTVDVLRRENPLEDMVLDDGTRFRFQWSEPNTAYISEISNSDGNTIVKFDEQQRVVYEKDIQGNRKEYIYDDPVHGVVMRLYRLGEDEAFEEKLLFPRDANSDDAMTTRWFFNKHVERPIGWVHRKFHRWNGVIAPFQIDNEGAVYADLKKAPWQGVDVQDIEERLLTIIPEASQEAPFTTSMGGRWGRVISTNKDDIYPLLSEIPMPSKKAVKFVDLGSGNGSLLLRAASFLGQAYPDIQFEFVGLEGNESVYIGSVADFEEAQRQGFLPDNVTMTFTHGTFQEGGERVLRDADIVYSYSSDYVLDDPSKVGVQYAFDALDQTINPEMIIVEKTSNLIGQHLSQQRDFNYKVVFKSEGDAPVGMIYFNIHALGADTQFYDHDVPLTRQNAVKMEDNVLSLNNVAIGKFPDIYREYEPQLSREQDDELMMVGNFSEDGRHVTMALRYRKSDKAVSHQETADRLGFVKDGFWKVIFSRESFTILPRIKMRGELVDKAARRQEFFQIVRLLAGYFEERLNVQVFSDFMEDEDFERLNIDSGHEGVTTGVTTLGKLIELDQAILVGSSPHFQAYFDQAVQDIAHMKRVYQERKELNAIPDDGIEAWLRDWLKTLGNHFYGHGERGVVMRIEGDDAFVIGALDRNLIRYFKLRHARVMVIVRNSRGQILVGRKADFKKEIELDPQSGHVEYGLSFKKNALRELTQEGGVPNGYALDPERLVLERFAIEKNTDRFQPIQVVFRYDPSADDEQMWERVIAMQQMDMSGRTRQEYDQKLRRISRGSPGFGEIASVHFINEKKLVSSEQIVVEEPYIDASDDEPMQVSVNEAFRDILRNDSRYRRLNYAPEKNRIEFGSEDGAMTAERMEEDFYSGFYYWEEMARRYLVPTSKNPVRLGLIQRLLQQQRVDRMANQIVSEFLSSQTLSEEQRSRLFKSLREWYDAHRDTIFIDDVEIKALLELVFDKLNSFYYRRLILKASVIVPVGIKFDQSDPQPIAPSEPIKLKLPRSWLKQQSEAEFDFGGTLGGGVVNDWLLADVTLSHSEREGDEGLSQTDQKEVSTEAKELAASLSDDVAPFLTMLDQFQSKILETVSDDEKELATSVLHQNQPRSFIRYPLNAFPSSLTFKDFNSLWHRWHEMEAWMNELAADDVVERSERFLEQYDELVQNNADDERKDILRERAERARYYLKVHNSPVFQQYVKELKEVFDPIHQRVVETLQRLQRLQEWEIEEDALSAFFIEQSKADQVMTAQEMVVRKAREEYQHYALDPLLAEIRAIVSEETSMERIFKRFSEHDELKTTRHVYADEVNAQAGYIIFRHFVIRISLDQAWQEDALIQAAEENDIASESLLMSDEGSVQVLAAHPVVTERVIYCNGWKNQLKEMWEKAIEFNNKKIMMEDVIREVEQAVGRKVNFKDSMIRDLESPAEWLREHVPLIKSVNEAQARLSEGDRLRYQEQFESKVANVKKVMREELRKIGVCCTDPEVIILPDEDVKVALDQEDSVPSTINAFDLIVFPVSYLENDNLSHSYIHESLHVHSDFYVTTELYNSGLNEMITEYLTVKLMMMLEGEAGSLKEYWERNRGRFAYINIVDTIFNEVALTGEGRYVSAYFFNDFYYLFESFDREEWNELIHFSYFGIGSFQSEQDEKGVAALQRDIQIFRDFVDLKRIEDAAMTTGDGFLHYVRPKVLPDDFVQKFDGVQSEQELIDRWHAWQIKNDKYLPYGDIADSAVSKIYNFLQEGEYPNKNDVMFYFMLHHNFKVRRAASDVLGKTYNLKVTLNEQVEPIMRYVRRPWVLIEKYGEPKFEVGKAFDEHKSIHSFRQTLLIHVLFSSLNEKRWIESSVSSDIESLFADREGLIERIVQRLRDNLRFSYGAREEYSFVEILLMEYIVFQIMRRQNIDYSYFKIKQTVGPDFEGRMRLFLEEYFPDDVFHIVDQIVNQYISEKGAVDGAMTSENTHLNVAFLQGMSDKAEEFVQKARDMQEFVAQTMGQPNGNFFIDSANLFRGAIQLAVFSPEKYTHINYLNQIVLDRNEFMHTVLGLFNLYRNNDGLLKQAFRDLRKKAGVGGVDLQGGQFLINIVETHGYHEELHRRLREFVDYREVFYIMLEQKLSEDNAANQNISEKMAYEYSSASFIDTLYDDEVDRENQDALWVAPDNRVAVVADGMGGGQAGEMASRIIVDTIKDAQISDKKFDSLHDVKEFVEQVVIDAENNIIRYAQENSIIGDVASTMSLIVFWHDPVQGTDHYVIANVGDSRISLRWPDGTAEQLTRDDSGVELMRQEGKITAKQAEVHEDRNQLSDALGFVPNRQSLQAHQLFIGIVRPGSVFVLMSDGISDNLGQQRIFNRLKKYKEPQDILDALVKEATRIAIKPKTDREKKLAKWDDRAGITIKAKATDEAMTTQQRFLSDEFLASLSLRSGERLFIGDEEQIPISTSRGNKIYVLEDGDKKFVFRLHLFPTEAQLSLDGLRRSAEMMHSIKVLDEGFIQFDEGRFSYAFFITEYVEGVDLLKIGSEVEKKHFEGLVSVFREMLARKLTANDIKPDQFVWGVKWKDGHRPGSSDQEQMYLVDGEFINIVSSFFEVYKSLKQNLSRYSSQWDQVKLKPKMADLLDVEMLLYTLWSQKKSMSKAEMVSFLTKNWIDIGDLDKEVRVAKENGMFQRDIENKDGEALYKLTPKAQEYMAYYDNPDFAMTVGEESRVQALQIYHEVVEIQGREKRETIARYARRPDEYRAKGEKTDQELVEFLIGSLDQDEDLGALGSLISRRQEMIDALFDGVTDDDLSFRHQSDAFQPFMDRLEDFLSSLRQDSYLYGELGEHRVIRDTMINRSIKEGAVPVDYLINRNKELLQDLEWKIGILLDPHMWKYSVGEVRRWITSRFDEYIFNELYFVSLRISDDTNGNLERLQRLMDVFQKESRDREQVFVQRASSLPILGGSSFTADPQGYIDGARQHYLFNKENEFWYLVNSLKSNASHIAYQMFTYTIPGRKNSWGQDVKLLEKDYIREQDEIDYYVMFYKMNVLLRQYYELSQILSDEAREKRRYIAEAIMWVIASDPDVFLKPDGAHIMQQFFESAPNKDKDPVTYDLEETKNMMNHYFGLLKLNASMLADDMKEFNPVNLEFSVLNSINLRSLMIVQRNLDMLRDGESWVEMYSYEEALTSIGGENLNKFRRYKFNQIVAYEEKYSALYSIEFFNGYNDGLYSSQPVYDKVVNGLHDLSDAAMTAEATTGGVDFTKGLNVRVNGDGAMAAFTMDEAMVAQWQENLTGFEATIVSVVPTTARAFLGLRAR